ncbi:hypothetical protein I6J18_22680 [Peribacillus psychrosaccharolyticus]|uniref:Uncharacterized protein n=1 Tax=Peribacillus psychrosaccharolyticus TaxID=1407 RepID=A0A974NME1_PERPY|nr:hypothetical protein [Peribacillus psychrosaccharolyticus]MEC2056519.1 hypothetical protein [Peribacillus psychrosaccharolyticus]MED3745651.1 hypothetical protein [Peribacillus psychrosaccharolyticus]QQT00337.1 hypothetical protein I6J18_22680 [Peribacillus psychrosaccharolyticus]
MKKFRGKKRYFRKLWRELNVEQYNLDFGQEGWFDTWHTHLDFYGFGNNSMKIRREHIRAHIVLYNSLLEKLRTFDKPYQLWIGLVDEEAGLDAVYIHTPNPNEDNFPLKMEDLNWDCTVPNYLKDLINLSEFSVGHYKWESNNHYIIHSKSNGIKL